MVSERELVDLRAQVTRLQADSTAELLKHRERKELLEKAQQQCFGLLEKYGNCLNNLQSEREEHREQLAARDARIAELEGLFAQVRSRHLDNCNCGGCRLLDGALAGKGARPDSSNRCECGCNYPDYFGKGVSRG